jgi:hypothetical protein
MTTRKTKQAKQQRRSERKRKASAQQKAKQLESTQQLKRRLAHDERFQNLTLINNNQSEIKVSALLLDFLHEHQPHATTRQAFDHMVKTGIFAWNLAIVADEAEQQAEIDKHAAKVGTETGDVFRTVVNELIARKQQHFAQFRRLIVEYEITETAKGFDLSVVSTGDQPLRHP